MTLDFVSLLSEVLLIAILSVFISDAEECVKISSCSCHTSIGVIDLSPLTSRTTPRFQANDKDGYTDTWSPCIDSPVKCGGTANDVAICQISKDGVNQFVNGFQSTAKFSGVPEKSLTLTYTSTNVGTETRTSVIALTCDKASTTNTFKAFGESPSGSVHYTFTLSSPHACYKSNAAVNSGLSAGSVLLILFFVFVLIYIVGGILFLRFYRGASGVEMFPNREFWKDFPFLVKDGITFTFRGCKSDTTYSQI